MNHKIASDSSATDPEMVIIIEKLFVLSSLDNLAKNGRISPILAKGIGILDIKIVGRASDVGTLEPMDKCSGDKRAYNCLISHMKKCGYQNGRVIISHTNNLSTDYLYIKILLYSLINRYNSIN